MSEKVTKKETKKVKMANVYVPTDPLNEFEQVVELSINNFSYKVMRGVSVDVPIIVAERLKEMKLINDFRIL